MTSRTKPLYLNAEEVKNNLPLDKLIRGVETAFVHFSTKETGVLQPERMVLPVSEQNYFLIKPACSVPENTLSAKLLTLYPENESKYGLPSHQATVIIFNAENGEMEGVMDGVAVTDLRTAAATAVAVKHLSKESDNILAIIGTGHQAASHVKLLREVRKFKEIRIYGRSKERRDLFASTWDVTACESVEEAVKDAHVIVTVTLSSEPVLFFKWVKNNAFITIVGGCLPYMREVDDDIMHNSQVFTDSTETAYKTAGDIIGSKITIDGELGNVINGTVTVDWNKTRVFKSNGLALQDLVAGRIVIDTIMNKQ